MDLGIKLGKNFHRNKFGGLEIGLFNNPSKEFYGAQIGGGNTSYHGKGIQIGIANVTLDRGINNLFLGDLNFSGVQVSGNNHYDGKIKGLQIAAMTNIAKEVDGTQLSLGANIIEPYLSGESKAIQAGPVNLCTSRLIGVQIGIFCYAQKGKFLQLGLLTMRGGEKPWYLRVTPFVGYKNNLRE